MGTDWAFVGCDRLTGMSVTGRIDCEWSEMSGCVVSLGGLLGGSTVSIGLRMVICTVVG